MHPEHGYYVSRDPLGREGDFITAPEVSQMFGELLGLWAASIWKTMGSPSLLRLIELGPGRGTMMADALRAVRVLPPLYQTLSVHLVEINPVLREKQQATLSGVRNVAWHDNIDEVPEGPCIIFANEYFDVLPIHQVVKRVDRLARAHGRARPQRQAGVRRRARSDPALRGAAAASGARRAGRRGVRMAARFRDHEDRKPRARPGRRGADHRLRPCAQRCRRHLSGDRPPQLRRSPEGAGAGRRHRACRLPGAGARRGRRRRAGPRSGDARRVPETARHRDPRGRADGQSIARSLRGHFGRAETVDRRRPRRHGSAVQGARRFRAEPRLAAGLERRGEPAGDS